MCNLQRFQSFCEKMNHFRQKNYEQNCRACLFLLLFTILVFVFATFWLYFYSGVCICIFLEYLCTGVLYLYCKRIVASGSTWTMEEESECEEVEEVVPASGSHLVKTWWSSPWSSTGWSPRSPRSPPRWSPRSPYDQNENDYKDNQGLRFGQYLMTICLTIDARITK